MRRAIREWWTRASWSASAASALRSCRARSPIGATRPASSTISPAPTSIQATAVLTNEVVPASDEVAAALETAAAHPVLHLRRVRYAMGKPLAILENHLPDQLVDIGAADLGSAGLYQLMRAAGVRMKVAKQRIGAREGPRMSARC